MLVFNRRVSPPYAVDFQVLLSFHDRHRARLKTTCTQGREIAILLQRGEHLHCGDLLATDDGQCLQIAGLAEELSAVRSEHPLDLLRAAYHLGNRHVPLAIEERRILYLKDHVLDEMVRNLGLSVDHITDVFHAERGAYHQH